MIITKESIDPMSYSDKIQSTANGKTIRRIGLGSLAVLMGQGINILGQILVVPLFLWAWGQQLYGEWITLYAIVGYISLLNFGMQTYVVNRLNQFYSVGLLNDYTNILHSALSLYLGIAAIAGSLIAFAVFVAPVGQWLNLRDMDHLTTSIVALLLAMQVILAIPQGLIAGLYRTFQEFPRGAMLANFQRASILGLTALTLMVGGKLIQVAAVQLIPIMAFAAFILYDIRKRHPEVKISFSQSDWRLAISFLGPSLLFFLIQISGVLTVQGSIIVVSAFAGPAYVAVFAIHRTLTNLVRQIVGSLNTVLWPELTTLEARGDYSQLRIVHRSFVKMSFAACVFAGIWLHFTGRDIIELWTLGKITFNQRLLDIFLFYLVLQAPWLGSSVFPAAFNRHKNLATCYILSAVLGIGLAVVLIQHWGIVGVAVGLLIGDVLVCGWFVPLETCRILGDSIRKYWVEVLFRGLPVIFITGIVAWLASQIKSSSLISIFIVFGSVILTGSIVGYLIWLNKEEKKRITYLFIKLWNRVFKNYF